MVITAKGTRERSRQTKDKITKFSSQQSGQRRVSEIEPEVEISIKIIRRAIQVKEMV